MTPVFAILAVLVAGTALLAVTRRNLVHAALWLAASLVGVALVFLHLGAGFLGWVQVLVYVGAVAVLIVFAVLLTRGGMSEEEPGERTAGPGPGAGLGITVVLLGGLLAAILHGTPAPSAGTAAAAGELDIREVGRRLAGDLAVPLLTAGVLLTAALIGAVVLALPVGRRGGSGHGGGEVR